MADKQEDVNKTYTDKVLKRTREMARVKAGKASETPGNPESEMTDEIEAFYVGGNPHNAKIVHETAGNPQRGNPENTAQRDDNSVQLAHGGNWSELWSKINNMEAEKRKFESEQTELLSNIVLNVAKMQQRMEKQRGAVTSANEKDMKQPERSENDDSLSDILDSVSENESESIVDSFFTDLEDLYEDKQAFGPKIDEKLAQLVDRAIDKGMPDDQNREIVEKYLVPENCKRLEVPVVNKELWSALKEKRESDLALQAIQKQLKLAMIPNLLALEIVKNKGDETKIPQLLKDSFKILANGIHQCNRKRKLLIKPGIPNKYRKVCDLDIPVTENLFGDNLDTKVEEIEKQERRAQKFAGIKTGSFLYQRNAQRGKTTHQHVKQNKESYHKTQWNNFGSKGQSFRGKSPNLSYRGKRPH